MPLKMQINHFDLRRQPAELFVFFKKVSPLKVRQNKKCDITKTSGLVQVLRLTCIHKSFFINSNFTSSNVSRHKFLFSFRQISSQTKGSLIPD